RTESDDRHRKAVSIEKSMVLVWLAAVFHMLSSLDIFRGDKGLNLGFFNTASLVALIVVLLLITAALRKPVEKLGLVLYPLAALLLVLKISFPSESHLIKNPSWEMDIHIVTSIVSYSLFNIAAVQAILLALQDWQLRSHHPHRLIRSLPPLQTMETLLFQMIGIGLALLTVSLLTGFMFIEDLFAQHLAHKTVLSILAWFVFGILLVGRARYGWRGQTAIRWTLAGFISLMLAYFGSKLVLELILKKV
ncbi:MAG: cytochrome c biogenesis protein CcsA, partial [Pseudomonadota bacterium]